MTEDKVVGTEELTEWASTNSVHGTRLEIDEDGTGDILVARCLCESQSTISSKHGGVN